MFNNLYSNINIMNKALDGLWLRDKAINHNISNVNTPNYKKITISFEEQLKTAINQNGIKMNKTHGRHLPCINSIEKMGYSIDKDRNYSYRFDKNNVNIDVENANLAKNTIMYNAVINQVIDEFDKIKNVISEGSK